MGASQAAGRSSSAVSRIACLLGVLAMGGILWGSLIWIAQAFVPAGLN